MAKSRYADATKAARRAAMSAHKATAAANAGNADASAPPSASAAAEPARDARRDELTHVDAKGEVRMVDVSDKAETHRIAIAEGTILMHPETQAMVLQDRAKKGDVLACARVAGIMAIKRTSDIIPMCHPLLITKSKCDIAPIAPAGTPVEDMPEGWAPARAAVACAWVRSSITGITALISMCPLRIRGAITRPAPSTWASSAPRAGRSTPTRARRTRCPRASCCHATTTSTW